MSCEACNYVQGLIVNEPSLVEKSLLNSGSSQRTSTKVRISYNNGSTGIYNIPEMTGTTRQKLADSFSEGTVAVTIVGECEVKIHQQHIPHDK